MTVSGCPRLRRSLYAVGEEWHGFVLSGADFTRAIRPWVWGCRGPDRSDGSMYWMPRWEPTARGFFGGTAGGTLNGIDGRARIEPTFAGGGARSFFAPYDSTANAFRSDCELVTFEVQMDVRFARVRQDPVIGGIRPGDDGSDHNPPLEVLDRSLRVQAPAQAVPGIRMTIYCKQDTLYGGCGVPNDSAGRVMGRPRP